jgi:hypothetical protein
MSSTFRLLDSPAEIRLLIYDSLPLSDVNDKTVHLNEYVSFYPDTLLTSGLVPHNRSCRDVRIEVFDMIYNKLFRINICYPGRGRLGVATYPSSSYLSVFQRVHISVSVTYPAKKDDMEQFKGCVSALEEVLDCLYSLNQLKVFSFVIMPRVMENSFRSGMRDATRASTTAMVQHRWSWKQRELDDAHRILQLLKHEIA